MPGLKRRSSVNPNDSGRVPTKKMKKKLPKCQECAAGNLAGFEIEEESDECLALVSEELISKVLDTDVETCEDDTVLPLRAIAQAKFFCQNGHLCSLDVIESDEEIYMTGFMKAHSDTDPDQEGGVFLKQTCPIFEWYMNGLGEPEVHIYVRTESCFYKVLSVAPQYGPLFAPIATRACLTNHFVQCLRQESCETLDEVIDSFEANGPMADLIQQLTIEDFALNADFIYDQVRSFLEEPYDDGTDDLGLLEAELFQRFTEFCNPLKSKSKPKPKKTVAKKKVKVEVKLSKAIATVRIRNVFDTIFRAHDLENGTVGQVIATADNIFAFYQTRASTLKDCLPIYGKNTKLIGCSLVFESNQKQGKKMGRKSIPKEDENGCVEENSYKLKPGMFVMLQAGKGKEQKFGQIIRMKMQNNAIICHIQCFMKSYESVLGESSNPKEIFGSDSCLDVDAKKILCVLPVKHFSCVEAEPLADNELFYQHKHDKDSGAFTSLKPFDPASPTCSSCVEAQRLKYLDRVVVKTSSLEYDGQCFRPGTCVFVTRSQPWPSPPVQEKEKPYDKKEYPEKGRKEGSQRSTAQVKEEDSPYDVCVINSLELKDWGKDGSVKPEKVLLNVRVLLRPEDVEFTNERFACPHELFYSDIDLQYSMADVIGIAYVAHTDHIKEPLEIWVSQGESRFYISEHYDIDKQSFSKAAEECRRMKGGVDPVTQARCAPPSHPTLNEVLRCLDLFAGCGGLSIGLHQAGLSESRWAFEMDPDAADAFQANHPKARVFNQDINSFLDDVMNGQTRDSSGRKYPAVGEVDLICGGPPCQGFSAMNRYKEGDTSQFKNSLVASYYSVVDLYRPKMFIFENVKNFMMLDSGMHLKAAIRCTLDMGYQVRFGVLQAGAYGVPQSRNRTIIIGTLPSVKLPLFPMMTHCGPFLLFRVSINQQQLNLGITPRHARGKGTPFRATTVRDAITDLPDTGSKYLKPKSTYQKQMRLECSGKLTEQVSRNLGPLDQARIKLIPKNGDWRDLPNIRVTLSDGTVTNILEYIVRGKESAICPCCFLKKGEQKTEDCTKARMTLIPWCLPHTADKFNNWRGLYGRLDLDKQFSTTVTTPEPMGKQGQVVHPYYHRCISVLEAARSQGFPDSVKFSGLMRNKYRQIGNAVPPILASAIGRECVKALACPK